MSSQEKSAPDGHAPFPDTVRQVLSKAPLLLPDFEQRRAVRYHHSSLLYLPPFINFGMAAYSGYFDGCCIAA